MRDVRSLCGTILPLLGTLAGCMDLPGTRPEADPRVVEGVLTLEGDDGPDDIRVIASMGGVEVWVDGEAFHVIDPVHAIEIEAGAGHDIVRLSLTAVTELGFTVDLGAGNDRVVLSSDPSSPGAPDEVMDLALTVMGGQGDDVLEADIDYDVVRLERSRVAVDADLGAGDNEAYVFVATSEHHTDVETRVRGGDGDNVLDLEHVFRGDGAHVFAVELGDGENETSVRFGDGARGARPAPGLRSVTGSYVSGSGRNALELHSEIIEPLSSVFTVDYGTGVGDTMGRYKVKFPWSAAPPPPGAQVAPSQTKVIVLGATGPGGPIDLEVVVGDLEVDDPSELGTVTLQSGAAQQTDFDFIHQRASGTGDADDVAWTLALGDALISGDATLAVDAPPALDRLVYLQDGVELAAGGAMDVTLGGDGLEEAVLAHLLGISGAGDYAFLADGGAGNDVLAVLTDDVTVADGGSVTVHVTGGDGDDVLAMDPPAGLDRDGPIHHVMAAGVGTDDCFTAPEVPATDCAARSEIDDALLTMLEELFGAELVGLWRSRR